MVAVYRLSDGQFTRGWPSNPPFDPATEAQQEYPDNQRPDMRLERFDASSEPKKRPATAQEIAAFDAARAADIEAVQFDGQKMLKAVAIFFAQQLNIPLATAKTAILTIYRGL